MVAISVPALLLQAAGGRMALVQGGAAGRALLLAPAASGRVALVPFGGAAKAPLLRFRCAAGDGNNRSSSDDDDDKGPDFAKTLEELALGVVVQGDEELLDRLAKMAKEAGELLCTMMNEATAPLPLNIQHELILVVVGASFTEVENHCELGYVSAASVVAATRGLKTMAGVFLGSREAEVVADLDPKSVHITGASSEDKTEYVMLLARAFSRLLRTVKLIYLRRPQE